MNQPLSPIVDGQDSHQFVDNAGQRPLVLLAEQDPMLRRALAMLLWGHGYDVVESSSPELAGHVLDERRVGLIIFDIGLRGGLGWELWGRAEEKRRHTILVRGDDMYFTPSDHIATEAPGGDLSAQEFLDRVQYVAAPV